MLQTRKMLHLQGAGGKVCIKKNKSQIFKFSETCSENSVATNLVIRKPSKETGGIFTELSLRLSLIIISYDKYEIQNSMAKYKYYFNYNVRIRD